MIDFETIESILGTVGDEAGKIVKIVTTNKFSKARRLIHNTSTPPYGENPKVWRRRERSMKLQLWLITTFVKKWVNNVFNNIRHILSFFGSEMS